MPLTQTPPDLKHPDVFARRHIGPSDAEVGEMLALLGHESLDALGDAAVPRGIRIKGRLAIGAARGEHEVLSDLRALASQNEVWRSYLGMGYSGCLTPTVILRNVLENPGWYTQYTPYQAEISQGRLEVLLAFQTMVSDLTGLPVANASLLDEGTAAAEAMGLCVAQNSRAKTRRFLVDADTHPQTIAVVRTRAVPLGVEVVVGDAWAHDFSSDPVVGVLVSYPTSRGRVREGASLAERAHAAGALVVAATDLLALTLLVPPGAWGADVAIGSAQRFGVPMGYGGPHAAFFATRTEYQRRLPGRIIGLTKARDGAPALRLALQTREQHIRRDKATSNICTAQVLLAIMATLYAVYHGPEGLVAIARRTHRVAALLAAGAERLGLEVADGPFFDTLCISAPADRIARVRAAARQKRINLRVLDDRTLAIALDETVGELDLEDLLEVLSAGAYRDFGAADLAEAAAGRLPDALLRRDAFLTHPVFRTHHSETEFLRYLTRLQARDLSLTTSMIPLGSCTMKLNATTEMIPVTWPGFGQLHPFAPPEQARGYARLFDQLERWLAEITGFAAVSLQPNAGSQGEYAGLLVIREYHARRGNGERDVCLIPASAHGTNPASAALAGMRVVVVACDEDGNIDLGDLEEKAKANAERLAVLMVTYPSTHGVFEDGIRRVCEIVHAHGGQVYLDGANLNAQLGLCRPGDYGADVCHLNLHKTLCIPHGGGGPGMGPIAVAAHLAPYLPGHPVVPTGGKEAIGPVSSAPWGSASILPISYAFIALMGGEGLRRAAQVAILNANYMARRLEGHFPILYRGPGGLVAHEFILDLRGAKKSAGIEVEDVAKRLMDYGFHAPTVSFPVAGTLMIEPTESESKGEMDRFCDAMIAIHGEIEAVASGRWPREDNPLVNAPHTAAQVVADEWTHPYTREEAAFPAPWTREHKFWPPVQRADGVYGDRNLVCSCPPVEAYAG
jgi:glycine dehydrogenase